MTRRRTVALLCLAAAGGVALAIMLSRATSTGVPRGYPPVSVPADNPTSADKVALGRRLFYDRRLSRTSTVACADCHRQEFAFADPRARSVGATGALTRRHAMSLTNVAYNGRYTWANDELRTLEAQALVPLTHDGPIEMGFAGHEAAILQRLASEPAYVRLFANAFPEVSGAITLDTIVKAIAAFERTLVSFDAPYDRWLAGDRTALTEAAQRGFALFRSDRLKCASCHGGINFRITSGHRNTSDDDTVAYHNTGLYDVDGKGAYPDEDPGLIDVSDRGEDMGRFKSPTLRNIAVTAPYMHDGSVATLREVIAHYAAGGRQVTSGPLAGDGRTNRHKSPLVTGFPITGQEVDDLVAFLESLTDARFLTNPALSNPFEPQP